MQWLTTLSWLGGFGVCDLDSYVGWNTTLLVGPPMPDRLKDRDQTKSGPWSSRLGFGLWANNLFRERKKNHFYRNYNNMSR